MDPELIPAPGELWWSAVVLAALHRVGGADICHLDPITMAVSLDHPEGRVGLQRCQGDRWVLWARSVDAPPAPPDARREAPDWALGGATDDERPTFVAWFAHREWDASETRDGGVPRLLRPLLSVDPLRTAAARAGRLAASDLQVREDHERLGEAMAVLEAAAADPAPLARGAVGSRLRDQVHGQMREAREADRMLLQQPPELVRWAQAHGTRGSFEHSVMLRRGVSEPALTNTALPRSVRCSLDHVLLQLQLEEASDEHGGWHFARVRYDGQVVGFDRAFDHWPRWWRVRHPGQGHTLDELAWEMAQRAPRWRPSWAGLLPRLDAR